VETELTYSVVDIDTIKPHPNNARQGDIGAISESLRINGQYRPIVVQKKTNFILAGNHTYKAARLLGWKDIAVTFFDCDNERALRILLVDNRANDLATYDDKALTEILEELANTSIGLEGTLFDGDALDELLSDVEKDFPKEFPTVDTDLETEHTCPKCGYEWSGKSN
jgi:ParB-like chromosome segregation protein Spo0J